MSRTRIKICGIKDPETALRAAEAGADAVGLMLIARSPRYVSAEQAFEILTALPPLLTGVAVIADMTVDAFSDLEQICPAPLVQMHGNEDDETITRCGPGVVKAFRFDPDTIDDDVARFDAIEEIDALLIDGSAGGEGMAFDWSALGQARERTSKPVFLAGGLNPENVGEAIRAVRPYAVDVSSGVESAPGVKDAALMHAFCDAVREADAEARRHEGT